VPEVPSWSEEATWRVVYKGGVGCRKSACYSDKSTKGAKLDKGEVFKGIAVAEAQGNGEMIRISNDKAQWVPLKTTGGKEVCKKSECAPPPSDPPPEDPPPPRPPPRAPDEDPPPPPPEDMACWKVHMSNGRPYWANTETGETCWNDPTDGAVPPPPMTRKAARKKPKKETPEASSEEEEESDSDSDGSGDDSDDDQPKPLRPGQKLAKGKRGEKQKKALKYLGWNKKAWKRKNVPDDLEGLEWDDLNRKQKSAAKYLDYNEDSWNDEYCEDSGSGSSDDY